MNKKFVLFTSILLVIIFSTSYAQAGKWGIAYSPVANQDQLDWTVDTLDDLGVNRLRMDIHWSVIESTQGTYNWTALDQRMESLTNAGIKILVTLSMLGPEWACSEETNSFNCLYNDNDDFYDFVEALLNRYPNQIDIIQYGNEWNRSESWLGTKENFVDIADNVYDLVSTYSPSTAVSLGSVSRLSMVYMLACEEDPRLNEVRNRNGTWYTREMLDVICGWQSTQDTIARDTWIFENALYDGVDIHLYDDQENWELYVTKVDELISGEPIICSEFGGPNLNWYPDTDEESQADWLQIYLDMIDDITSINAAYFFKMRQGGETPHCDSALVNEDLSHREAYDVYADFMD